MKITIKLNERHNKTVRTYCNSIDTDVTEMRQITADEAARLTQTMEWIIAKLEQEDSEIKLQ